MDRFFLLLSMAVLAAGCSQVTPQYDARFGDAVRQARRQMTIDPDAGRSGGMALGLDGRATHEAMQRYQESFRSPPPAVNVINIGGAIGEGGSGNGQ